MRLTDVPGGFTARFVRCRRRSSAQARRQAVRVCLGVLVSSAFGVALLPSGALANVAPPPGDHQASTVEIVVKHEDLGIISKYLFGTNLLWADDAEGAFDPATGGFYPEFVSTLRSLGVSVVRYPGGTTSDSFDWLRAIGPKQDRQANEPYGMQAASLSRDCCVLDGPEPSTVGPDEFGQLLDDTGAAGTVTVNFATGTAQEAADFVGYMTAPYVEDPSSNPDEPSYWAAMRARDGHAAPYDVPYWEVGNEQAFPGQYGWRSGQLVSLGPHAITCPPGQVATCLYAFGGTTSFSGQPVGTFADEVPSASYSTGEPGQIFYLYFPPVVPGSATVYVDGQPWSEVADLSTALAGSQVYALDPGTGAISFGGDTHGEAPPLGAKITVSYESGPHDGFVEFYRAMKAMNPQIQVCESEETDVAFLQLMGDKYPYDCVELHEYAQPRNVEAPLPEYEEELLAAPAGEGAALATLQAEIRQYSGKQIPVFVTEYGQLVAPVPAADPKFNLSLDEGLLIGAQLVEWIDHGVPVAEKYLADSAPFGRTDVAIASSGEPSLKVVADIDKVMVDTGLSVNNAMVARQGSVFVAEPTGEVLGLMSRLEGSELLFATTLDDPVMGENVPELWVIAGEGSSGCLDLVVINADPEASVPAEVVLDGLLHTGQLTAYVLDGPSPTSYNTATAPHEVSVTDSTVEVGGGIFTWTSPAHSVSLLQLSTSTVAAPVSHLRDDHGRAITSADGATRHQGAHRSGRRSRPELVAAVVGQLYFPARGREFPDRTVTLPSVFMAGVATPPDVAYPDPLVVSALAAKTPGVLPDAAVGVGPRAGRLHRGWKGRLHQLISM